MGSTWWCRTDINYQYGRDSFPEVITLSGASRTVEMQVPVLNLTREASNAPQQSFWAEEVEQEDAQHYAWSHVQVTMNNDDGTLLCYNTESI